MVVSKQSYVCYDRDGLYLSGCHKHSNQCHSLQPDSSVHSGSPQHEEQSPGDKSDTGRVWGLCNACTSCRMIHRFPTMVQFHKLLFWVNTRKTWQLQTLGQSATWTVWNRE